MSDLLLNLGAGTMPVEGYISLDAHPYTPETVVCRFPPLPYDDESVRHIYAGHVMEHIKPWDLMPLLAECKRVLMPGGSLTVVVPDADKARLMMESKRLDGHFYALAVQGAKYDDMPHSLIFNPKRVREMLEVAGFQIDEGYRWKEDSRVYDTTVIYQAGARGIKL